MTKIIVLTWLLVLAKKTHLSCPEPEPLANVYRFWNGGQDNSTVTYQCYSGYTFINGNLTRSCENGSYTGSSPECVLDCGKPRSIHGVTPEYSLTTAERKVVYTCWDNYTQFDEDENMIIHCNPYTQRWSMSAARCKVSYNLVNVTSNCTETADDPEDFPRFDVSDEDVFYQITDLKFSFKDNVKVLPDNITITVRKTSGTWTIPNCAFLERQSLTLNNTMHVNCSVGAIGQSVVFIPAFGNGSYSNFGICDIHINGRPHIVDCGRPEFVLGAKAQYSETSFQSKASYSCENGFYALHKGSIATCLFFNTWSTSAITCTSEPNVAAGRNIFDESDIPYNVLVDNLDETCTSMEPGWLKIDFGLDHYEFREVVIHINAKARKAWAGISVRIHSLDGRDHPCYTQYRFFYLPPLSSFTCPTFPIGSAFTITVDITLDICEIRAFGFRFKEKKIFECLRSSRGQEYKGYQSRTLSGSTCIPWDIPGNTRYREVNFFPDDSVADAKNYCRNPGGIYSRPWCFTSQDGKYWEYCPIVNCTHICSLHDDGFDFTGEIDKTTSRKTCQKWSSVTDSKLRFCKKAFPDFKDDHNFCRNPGNSQSRPWCYTDLDNLEYEPCEIPDCPVFPLQEPMQFAEDSERVAVRFDECFIWTSVFPVWQYRVSDMQLTGKFMTRMCHIWKNNITMFCFEMDRPDLGWRHVFIHCYEEETTQGEETTSIMTSTSADLTMSDFIYTDDFQMLNTSVHPQSLSTSSNEIYPVDKCACYSRSSNINTIQIVKERIINITVELIVPKETLSSTIRRRKSAEDDRPSVSYLGYVAMAILSLTMSIIVIPDLLHLFLYIKWVYFEQEPLVPGCV